jgi:hypothetical protein
MLRVRSEIGPYHRLDTALSRVAKNNRRCHPDEKLLSLNRWRQPSEVLFEELEVPQLSLRVE